MKSRALLLCGIILLGAGYGLHRTLLDDLPATTHEAGKRPENRVAVFGAQRIGQTVRPPAPNVSALDLFLFGPAGVRLQGNAILHVRRSPDDPEDLRTAEAPVADLKKDTHTRFRFPLLHTDNTPRLFLLLEFPSGTKERPLFARADLPTTDRPPWSWNDYADGSLIVNDQPTEGDLAFRFLTTGRRPFGTQVSAAAVLGGFVLIAAALCLFARPRRGPSPTLLLCLLLAAGLPVIFFLPLFNNPTFLGTGDWDMNTTVHAAAERALLTERAFPGWNPYLCGGTPLAAFPEAPVFSPFFGTVLLGGPVLGFKVNIVLHGIIGFLGMLAWLKRGWKLSWPAAFLGAATVMFSSFVGLHLSAGHSRKVAIAWIPWALYFFQRALRDPQRRTAGSPPFRPVVAAAASLALMFFDGSVYLTAYTALALALLGGFETLLKRQWRPLALAGVTLVLAGLLAGARLAPTLASLSSLRPALDRTNAVPSFHALVDIFLDPNQDPFAVKLGFPAQPWFEYGAYVGIASVAFAILGVIAGGRRLLPWIGVGLVFLLGATIPSAQRALAVLPLVGNLRNPQRMVVMVTVVVGLAAALGFDRLTRWLRGRADDRGSTAVRGALGVLAALVIAHLIFVNTGTFANTFTVPPPGDTTPTNRTSGLFRQGWARPVFAGQQDSFVYTAVNVARHRGSVNRCSVAGIRPTNALRLSPPDIPPEAATEFTDAPYAGEVFFLAGRGTTEVHSYETTRVTAAYTAITEGVLALNTNFHPGWRVRITTDHGMPVSRRDRSAQTREGLVTTLVPPGSGQVTFSYTTPHLGTGLVVSGIGLALSLWLIVRRRVTPAQP